MKNEGRKFIFLLFSSSRVDLFVKKRNCRNLSLIQLLFAQEFSSDSGQSKCLRLLKVLRDMMFPDAKLSAETGETDKIEDFNLAYWISIADNPLDDASKLISSYVLKTLVLYERQKNKR